MSTEPRPPLAGEPPSDKVRARILAAAAALVAEGGAEAATTRAVATAAAVQAPTIYRLFGDKDGLLDAVAEKVLADHVAGKSEERPGPDAIEDMVHAWDAHVAFGLAHPAVFALMVAPRSGKVSAAMAAGLAVLRERVRRVARTGRLRVSEERAVDLIHAMGTGVVLALLRQAPAAREGLAEAAGAAVFATIVGEPAATGSAGAVGAASALRASLDEVAGLTPGELLLLEELLKRIARG